MLRLENIGLSLNDGKKAVSILENVNIGFERGKMYALTGPNGSGKSTIARLIMGIQTPTAGRVLFEGKDITGFNITERARLGIGYAFQQPARFKGLRVANLLEIAMRNSDQADCQCLRRIGLCPEEYLERPLDASLSGGEIKRIEVASLLAQNPRVRIFDEPEAGVDLWSFGQLTQVIKDSHRPDAVTIIISHQEKILNMVDQIILVVDGTISMQGDRETVWPLIQDRALCACRRSCTREDDLYADCPR